MGTREGGGRALERALCATMQPDTKMAMAEGRESPLRKSRGG